MHALLEGPGNQRLTAALPNGCRGRMGRGAALLLPLPPTLPRHPRPGPSLSLLLMHRNLSLQHITALPGTQKLAFMHYAGILEANERRFFRQILQVNEPRPGSTTLLLPKLASTKDLVMRRAVSTHQPIMAVKTGKYVPVCCAHLLPNEQIAHDMAT